MTASAGEVVILPVKCLGLHHTAEPASARSCFQEFLQLQVRGKGLFNAIEVRKDRSPTAWDICLRLKEYGLLAKPTHGNIIRLAPPLTLTEEQLLECADIIKETILSFPE